MQSGLVRWIAYMLLAALVVVASCQAMAGQRPAGVAQDASVAAEAGR